MQQGVSTSVPNIVFSNLQIFSVSQRYSVIAQTFSQHNKTAAEISTAVTNQTLLIKYCQANCTAERNQTPHIFRIKAVMRPEGFNDLPFKLQGVHVAAMNVVRIPGVIDHHLVNATVRQPFVKSFQLDVMVQRIPDVFCLAFRHIVGKFIEPLPGQIYRFGKHRGAGKNHLRSRQTGRFFQQVLIQQNLPPFILIVRYY